MNFLAHCLLAHQATPTPLPDLVVGGFLGDFIKGPVPPELPAGLAMGVRLHRRIDAFSNQLPGITHSCGRFPAPLRRLAPVFVDVVADHCLARHWEQFSAEPLPVFAERTYRQIAASDHLLSPAGARFFEYMQEVDLLTGYRQRGTMHRGLTSITRRLRKQHLDAELATVVELLLADLEEDFFDYFPELLEHAQGWAKRQLSAAPQSS